MSCVVIFVVSALRNAMVVSGICVGTTVFVCILAVAIVFCSIRKNGCRLCSSLFSFRL